MIGDVWTIFIAPARCLARFHPMCASESIPIIRGGAFRLICRLLLPLSTSQTDLLSVVRTLRRSPNCHSKRRSFSDTAPFM